MSAGSMKVGSVREQFVLYPKADTTHKYLARVSFKTQKDSIKTKFFKL